MRRRYSYVAILTVLTLVAALLRTAGLADLPPTADGVQAAASAFDYMEAGRFGTTMWQHPKLRNILLYWGLTFLGDGAWGLNGVSLAFGILSVPLISGVLRRLSGAAPAGLAAAFFLAVDPVHIDFSRQAIQEVYMPFFSLLGIYLGLLYRVQGRSILPVLAGISFGLGLAGKWYVLFPLMVTLFFLLRHAVPAQRNESRVRPGTLMFLVVSLTVVPMTVYVLTYLPWMLHRGYDLADLFHVHRIMAGENLVHAGFNAYLMENDSRPYLWFIKPVAFADFIIQQKGPVVLLAISNPIVWMATLPAALFVLLRGWRERSFGFLFLSGLFWCSYLPLLLASRPIWVNTSLAVAPFAFMLVAWSVTVVAGGCSHGQRMLFGYLAAVAVVAVPLYLLAVGKGYNHPLLHPIVELYRPIQERQWQQQ